MGTRKFRTPGSAQQSALEAAKTLMAERLKYEQWLDDLEAKKDATPAKVFERVQKDYLERLQNVVEQLGKYTATLEEHAEMLTGKLRDLQAMEEANEEEQAEQGLRKQVGEISAAEWESGSKKAQKELAKIKENQEAIETDLAQIRDLLGDGEEEDEEAPAKGSKGGEFNELEFLSSVVGQSTTPIPVGKVPEPRSSGATASPVTPAASPAKTPTPPAQPAASAAAPATPQPRTTPAPGTTAPAPRVSNPATAPPMAPASAATTVPTAPAAAPARTSNPAQPAAATPSPRSTPAGAAAPPAAETPAAARVTVPTPAAVATPAAPAAPPQAAAPAAAVPTAAAPVEEAPSAHRPTVATEQTKTLKCTECGSMNYPTEWYCERCGAELTGA